ncbi:MAG TPA: hypothetical protein VGI40_26285 [Pirellulaceae bacterium]|jgi:hypothetical protein
MGEVLTIAEIESLYRDEWILIADPQTNTSLEVLAGRVLFHSADRDEVYRKAIELKPRSCAMHFTGQIPANAAVVL